MIQTEIRIADWSNADDRITLGMIRERVFIEEQQVPFALEWDEFDNSSMHFLAIVDNQYVATARLKHDGQFGRMAVLAEFRHQGIGSALLRCIVQQAQQRQLDQLYCHAQVSALDFYCQHGFVAYGNEFDDAGIAHQTMQRTLDFPARNRA